MGRQVGRHSPDHAKALADANVLPKLVATLVAPSSSDDLKTKCKRSLKFITEKLTDMKALDKLLQERGLPEGIVKYALAQIAKVCGTFYPCVGPMRFKLRSSFESNGSSVCFLGPRACYPPAPLSGGVLKHLA
jgi:hypothetical protein